MTRSTIGRTFAIGAVAALALGLAPMAKAERKECSVATLEGSFVRKDVGFVMARLGRPDLSPVSILWSSTEMAHLRRLAPQA